MIFFVSVDFRANFKGRRFIFITEKKVGKVPPLLLFYIGCSPAHTVGAAVNGLLARFVVGQYSTDKLE